MRGGVRPYPAQARAKVDNARAEKTRIEESRNDVPPDPVIKEEIVPDWFDHMFISPVGL